jgi:molecular chaperone Hsp33
MDYLLKGTAEEETLLVVGLVDTGTVEKARSIHDAHPTASAALGRVISAAVLLSSTLKEGQRVTVQVSGDGPLGGVVAEADWLCRVRGYVKRPHVHLMLSDGKLDVGRGIGKGFLNVIKDLGLKEPYRGTVALKTGQIATDLAYYFHVSEQIPAAVSLGVYVDTDYSVKASGGFMVQALPGAREEVIDYLEDRIKGLRPVSSMVLDGLGPGDIMVEAVGLPVNVLEKKDVVYYCPCDKERVLDAITALGKKDIEDFAAKGEAVDVRCQFCKTEYVVPPDELLTLLNTADPVDKRPG